ncbi:hypothetical protein [Columbia Basin potato purple top phytoplasma]|uniref:Peptidase M41 domain-containing protein n=1 Tax=Columbia Basin potato purple top phytoplasma TaxID=307134 RepID=A0ABT5L9P9_9MOLU|nr:hypothetical protein [Columbia Basin potato purple top phytoplasma]MDC9032232.1 hypothetical protein [Columbia Basin potato purple top phytoplasma]
MNKTTLHELGHTLVCLDHIPNQEEITKIIEKVTIEPEGTILGYLMKKPNIKFNNFVELKINLGGLASEMLFYKNSSQTKITKGCDDDFYIVKGCSDDFKEVRKILKILKEQNPNHWSLEFRKYTAESEKIISKNISLIEEMFKELIERKTITTEKNLQLFKDWYKKIKK